MMTLARLRASSLAVIGTLWVAAVSAFLILPLVVIVGSSFGTDAFLKFPPTGFTLAWYDKMLSLREFVTPLTVSIRIGCAVAILSGIAGTVAAFALSRLPRIQASGEAIFLLPIVLPSLVIGLSLLVLFNLLGITNTWITLILGHTAVTMPIVFQTAASLAASLDRNVEFAAMTLGARPKTVLFLIVLPLLRPAIVAGLVMAFALSFDEFVISILLSHGGVTTFPVALFTYMRFSVNPTLAAISTTLILGTCLVVLVLHRLVGLDLLFGLRRQRG
jgi:putative spermidine/putrescine transport system permease protein